MHESAGMRPRKSNRGVAPNCTEKISQAIRRKRFRRLAEIAWPDKTAFALVAATGKSLRTARYLLAGHHAPSDGVLDVVFDELRRSVK